MSPADDEHVSGLGAPSAELEWRAVQEERDDRDESDHGDHMGAHAQRVDVPPIAAPRHPLADRHRYFLSSFEPSGEFDAVIVALTDDGRRRYFTTRDGASLDEVDEVSFERRRESGTRSMIELDERELGELEVELHFVRAVRGRDPIAEADAAVDAEAEAAAEERAEIESEAAAEPEADADTASDDEVTDAAADAPSSDAAADPLSSDAADEAAAAEENEHDLPIAHRATWAPVEVADEAVATEANEEEIDGVDDRMTEEFEEMVMASTTMTSEWPADAASVIDEAPEAHEAPDAREAPDVPDAAPLRSPAPIPADEAIAQVALAKGIAFVAHRDKHDRSGAPYIDHPGRIAERFDPVTEPVEAAAAWLHDVIEDTPVTAQELFEAGVLPAVIHVVQLLTRTSDVSPDEYYAAIRRHPIARRVKLADIDDNTARWRLRRLDYDTQLRLVEKYRYARQALGTD